MWDDSSATSISMAFQSLCKTFKQGKGRGSSLDTVGWNRAKLAIKKALLSSKEAGVGEGEKKEMERKGLEDKQGEEKAGRDYKTEKGEETNKNLFYKAQEKRPRVRVMPREREVRGTRRLWPSPPAGRKSALIARRSSARACVHMRARAPACSPDRPSDWDWWLGRGWWWRYKEWASESIVQITTVKQKQSGDRLYMFQCREM